jgi:hypothetical protein
MNTDDVGGVENDMTVIVHPLYELGYIISFEMQY